MEILYVTLTKHHFKSISKGEINMDYQKKVDMKEVKEIQKQTTEIAKILKKEGYEAGVIALGRGAGVATSVFGSRKDVLFTVYTILENLKEEDKLILLSMISGIKLGGRTDKN